MSVYLAWSVYKLVLVLIALFAVAGLVVVVDSGSGKLQLKQGVLTFIMGCVVVVAMAFNIGDRQSELGRSSFNAEPPAVIDLPAAPTQRLTRESVSRTFEQAVKKTD